MGKILIPLLIISTALIFQTIYIIIYKNQIKDIGKQLAFISKHQSFKFIQTQIRPKEIHQLTQLCNTLLQNQRELSQDFQKKSEEINTTIVSLSHDIRTPLTSLDGYLQLAKHSQDFKEQSQYILLAETRIRQINTLVDELFLYTKLQNPDYTLELDSIDIINLLKRSLFTFIDDFSQNSNEPMVNLPESPVYIEGNEQALDRIYENIIKNYFIHGEGGLSIHFEKSHNEVFLHFTNKVKQSQLINFNKIFNRFYKEDPARTKHSSGLGLSIVKSLMEKLSGNVHASLENNQFRISLVFTKNKEDTYEQEGTA